MKLKKILIIAFLGLIFNINNLNSMIFQKNEIRDHINQIEKTIAQAQAIKGKIRNTILDGAITEVNILETKIMVHLRELLHSTPFRSFLNSKGYFDGDFKNQHRAKEFFEAGIRKKIKSINDLKITLLRGPQTINNDKKESAPVIPKELTAEQKQAKFKEDIKNEIAKLNSYQTNDNFKHIAQDVKELEKLINNIKNIEKITPTEEFLKNLQEYAKHLINIIRNPGYRIIANTAIKSSKAKLESLIKTLAAVVPKVEKEEKKEVKTLVQRITALEDNLEKISAEKNKFKEKFRLALEETKKAYPFNSQYINESKIESLEKALDKLKASTIEQLNSPYSAFNTALSSDDPANLNYTKFAKPFLRINRFNEMLNKSSIYEKSFPEIEKVKSEWERIKNIINKDLTVNLLSIKNLVQLNDFLRKIDNIQKVLKIVEERRWHTYDITNFTKAAANIT